MNVDAYELSGSLPTPTARAHCLLRILWAVGLLWHALVMLCALLLLGEVRLVLHGLLGRHLGVVHGIACWHLARRHGTVVLDLSMRAVLGRVDGRFAIQTVLSTSSGFWGIQTCLV